MSNRAALIVGIVIGDVLLATVLIVLGLSASYVVPALAFVLILGIVPMFASGRSQVARRADEPSD